MTDQSSQGYRLVHTAPPCTAPPVEEDVKLRQMGMVVAQVSDLEAM
jgi:hypothetical protein